ncbi:MAG: phosphotransferase [archaeon]|nr:MAG: phosphotransferase [archaeon]
MKLSKKEILEVAKQFDLGKMLNYKLIEGGLANYNYILKTNKGKFIIRIVGDTTRYKVEHLKLQFRVLYFLNESGFPYSVPYPLKTRDSKNILKFGNKKVWVYRMLRGNNRKKANLIQMKQMAKALAIYHKYIKNIKEKPTKDISIQRVLRGFRKMKNIKEKTEEDRLALQYRDYFKDLFKKIKIDVPENRLFIHSDFDPSNVMFYNGKLDGIIDFDETNYAPRVVDVAVSIRDLACANGRVDVKKAKIFLREYEKVSKLSKKEKKAIIPIILFCNIDFFLWAYVSMKKMPQDRKKYMKEMIVLTKNMLKKSVKF